MRYNIPEEYKPFITSVKRQCKKYGIELILSPSKRVVLTDDYLQECSGYFCDTDKALVVACGKPFEEWVEILIHEFSHMEQWKSDERWNDWNDNTGKTWDWLAGNIMLNKTQVLNMLDSMVELEKDCEIRAIEKIKKWNLPVNLTRYVKKANVYLYSYHMMPILKRFPTGIYTDKTLIEMAPKGFKKTYRNVPKDMSEYIILNYSKK
jgi:hypothetical protein